MLVAKLKTPIDFVINISPTKTETRTADSFYVIPLGYTLGAKEAQFHVMFGKLKEVPKNPSSYVQGEGEVTYEVSIEKVFGGLLNEQELSNWGNTDESLLQIFAQKYEIEIDSFLQIN